MAATKVEINLLDGSPKGREVLVGDRILHWAVGHLGWGYVRKITKRHVWVEYTSPSTGETHNTKRYREIALMYSKFY